MLRDYRVKAGLSQLQLAERLGWMGAAGQRRISYIELKKGTTRLEDCRAVVAALNEAGVPCTLDDVFPPSDAGADAAQDVA